MALKAKRHTQQTITQQTFQSQLFAQPQSQFFT